MAQTESFTLSSSPRCKKIAVVLCGSGYLDGSEIRETVGVLWAISQLGAEAQCFAPEGPQSDVMNCLSGEPAKGETRQMLVESARIARGKVQSLSELKAEDFNAIILPGGFGAAKNLCDFASKGSAGSVRPELGEILREFHRARKPIGALCIAPAVLALALPGTKLELTVGAPGEAAQEIEKLGHRHIVCAPSACHVDRENKVVTTPAYMYDQAPLHEIFDGIRRCVSEVISLSSR